MIVSTLLVWACNQKTQQDHLHSAGEEDSSNTHEVSGSIDFGKYLKVASLMHIVTIPVKQDLSEEDKQQLISELKSLQSVEGVQHLHVGIKTETGDARMASGNWLVLSAAFSGVDQLAAYQQNPFHLEVRERSKKYLSGPPTVYDYTIQ